MNEKKESEILREICDWLFERGVFFWRSNNIPVFARNNAGKMAFRALPKYTPRGLPDVMVVTNGTLICMEVKRPGAKLREAQKAFQENMAQNGGIYWVVTSIDDVVNEVLTLPPIGTFAEIRSQIKQNHAEEKKSKG